MFVSQRKISTPSLPRDECMRCADYVTSPPLFAPAAAVIFDSALEIASIWITRASISQPSRQDGETNQRQQPGPHLHRRM